MEKVIVALRASSAGDDWVADMCGPVAGALLELDLPGVTLNVCDGPVRDSLMTLTGAAGSRTGQSRAAAPPCRTRRADLAGPLAARPYVGCYRDPVHVRLRAELRGARADRRRSETVGDR